MKYEDKATDLAKEFSRVLNSWIPEKIFEVNLRNKEASYKLNNCCASHDFCDANMAMDEAFQKVMQREFVFFNDEYPETEQQNEDDTDLINAAWNLAKENDFYCKK